MLESMRDSEALAMDKAVYLEAKRLFDKADTALKSRLIEEFPFKVGDKVEVVRDQNKDTKVGIVTRVDVRVYVSSYSGNLDCRVEPIIFALKKDGTASSKVQIFVYSKDRIILLERPAVKE